IDVRHGAGGHEGAEADLLLQAPIEHRGTERTALAKESDVAGLGHGLGKSRVQPGNGAHHTQAVGSDQADTRTAGFGDYLALKFGASGSGLAESRRDDDHPLHAMRAALADQARNGISRRDDHRQFHRAGDGADRRISLDAENTLALGIDRIDAPAKRTTDQVPQNIAANAAG